MGMRICAEPNKDAIEFRVLAGVVYIKTNHIINYNAFILRLETTNVFYHPHRVHKETRYRINRT